MNDMELALKDLMDRKASAISAAPDMRGTVRRARVRRVMNAGAATLAVVALAAISVVAAKDFMSTDEAPERVAGPGLTTEGEYGFTSEFGSYPVIASGEFRGTEWELTGEGTQPMAGDNTAVAMKFEVTDGDQTVSGTVDVLATDEILLTQHVEAAELTDGANVVFGAFIPGAANAIEVEVANGRGTTIPAHRFTEYDSNSTITGDFFIAFVPADSPGFVHARSDLGIDMELDEYGGLSLAPHVGVASGKIADATWSLEFAVTEPDRACLVFSTRELGSECFTRQQIEDAGPLFMVTFEREDVLGIVAILSDEVGEVLLEMDGSRSSLPWFQPAQEDRGEWPLRLVAVGLPPGSHGTLQATLGGTDIVAEERF
jgi:hypothetical protein